MEVLPVPVLEDNYSYVVVDKATRTAALVDPAVPKTVLEFLKHHTDLNVVAVLTTHHHWDHANGNPEIASHFAGIQIYGADDRIPGLTTPVSHNQSFALGSLTVTPLLTPCHTRGSCSYYVHDPASGAKAVFTGDTLFIAGCGRFFEGTAEQMHASLSTLMSLPDDTLVYCGHEYTLANLKFAASVEPTNPAVQAKLQWARHQAQTIPGTIGDEKQINPFVRAHVAEVQHSVAQAVGNLSEPYDALQILAHLRNLKNTFKA
ncbi:hydroxyacylglutathione hydrolase [Polychytrium aggregatum]|uniref:hydroxyacylglutathione hydrolase n=1 Tax=Polychytrium aggregatum TaxID=110093 RepID=UPI0022FE758A|nr:hydroxyacylglutathione hydrolase [Polychytrium aggregatum]KAI9202444.1 hydroxyacylglutathione hydrolase [Polychytrium aggregatum]